MSGCNVLFHKTHLLDTATEVQNVNPISASIPLALSVCLLTTEIHLGSLKHNDLLLATFYV